MVFSNLANMCSHLRNVSKAKLAVTSIPNTKMNRGVALALRNAGFFSSILVGGPKPPPNHLLLNTPSLVDEVYAIEPVTQANVASRRLWLGLKYWQGKPVLHDISIITKPKRKLNASLPELRELIHGRNKGVKSGFVAGLRSPGECVILATDQGIMESRDCIEKQVGGLLLLRAS